MLTDFFDVRLTELGKIKIGGKGEERRTADGKTWHLPEKHDYFTITTLNRDATDNLIVDAELMEQLTKEYGSGEPRALRQIPVRVLSNDPEDIMQSAYVWYGGKTVGAKSDGKSVTWNNDPATGAKLDAPKTEPWDDKFLELRGRPKRDGAPGPKLFKLHTSLSCVIAAKQARWGGIYKFRTTSIITGRQLYGSLIETLRLTNGVLVGMPLWLIVRPMQVTPEGKPTTIYVVHLELRAPNMEAIEEQAVARMRFMCEHKEQMRAIQTRYKLLALPPGSEPAKDAADINEEFQPETVGESAKPEPPKDADPLMAQATGAASGGVASEEAKLAPAGDAAPNETIKPAEGDGQSAGAGNQDENPTQAPAHATGESIAPISQPQIDRLVELQKLLKMNKREWTATLRAYSVTSGKDLNVKQAEELIGNLEAKLPQGPKLDMPREDAVRFLLCWLNDATKPQEDAFRRDLHLKERGDLDFSAMMDDVLALCLEWAREH